MRWDIVMYVVMVVGSVIIVIGRQWKEWKKNAQPLLLPNTAPMETLTTIPTVKVQKTSPWLWSALIICSLLLVMVAIGMISRMESKGYLPPPSPGITKVSAPVPAHLPTSASVTVSRADGWRPIRIYCQVGVARGVNVTPYDAVVTVQKPDGKMFMAGERHRYDVWYTHQAQDSEWQTWQVSTEDERDVTFNINWGS